MGQDDEEESPLENEVGIDYSEKTDNSEIPQGKNFKSSIF